MLIWPNEHAEDDGAEAGLISTLKKAGVISSDDHQEWAMAVVLKWMRGIKWDE